MKDKFKNIINLSKIFMKENENNLKLIGKKDKISKKSLLYWVYLILFFAIFYLSTEIVSYSAKIGKPQIFLNGFLLFLQILIIIRTIMVSLNVFYFSKDIENILYLPVKPVEILISKFTTILFMNYEIEVMFGIIPLLVYGIYIRIKMAFFFNLIISLILFPIFAILVVSIIMIFLMRTIKIFKNKDLIQVILSFVLIFFVMLFLNRALSYTFNNIEYINENQEIILNNINEKIIRVNKFFLSINPVANILQEDSFLKILFNYLKLIFINLVAMIVFVYLGNKLYLKQLLKAKFYSKNKKKKEIKINKSKKNKAGDSYIKKEFKLLFKNPLFLIQSIYPVIIITVMISVLIIALVPLVNQELQKEENKEIIQNLKFDIESVCLIVGTIQVVGLFNYSSITAFSREGKNAYIMKFLPISLYKQFIYKNTPQIVTNTIVAGVICGIIGFEIPAIGIKYILAMFVLSFLLILINSFILTIIDLLLPKLEWDAEYEILKNNKNKLLQYVLIFLNVLFLMFINKLFDNHNLDKSLIAFIVLLMLFFIVMNIFIWKNKGKMYKRIK